MKKKFKIFMGLCGVFALCALGTACGRKDTRIEELQKEGKVITVTYDPNGGQFFSLQGRYIVDLFDPNDFQKDSEGAVHIKLKEPTDSSSRPSPGGESSGISLTRSNYFFSGWYENRELKTLDGKVVDDNGKELVLNEDDGLYYYPDADWSDPEKPPASVTPAYSYSGYWDFANDTIDYADPENKVYQKTLYAGWVPYYEFHYYYQIEGETGWTQLSQTTYFDYKTTNAPNSSTADRDTIRLPQWDVDEKGDEVGGAMNYRFYYADQNYADFPKIEGTTFESAYTDPECKNQIIGSFEHQGTLDLEHGLAVNPVQNIYIKLSKGEQFRIRTAQQLIDNAKTDGLYTILEDLDFKVTDKEGVTTYLDWPSAFESGTFTGKMIANAPKKIQNATATHSSGGAYGGLFAMIAAEAELKNLTFEDATFDLATATRESEFRFGLFSGDVNEGAKVENVSVVNGTLKIGAIRFSENNEGEIDLFACGEGKDKVTQEGKIKVQVYGEQQFNGRDPETQEDIYHYLFIVNPENTKVENGKVILSYNEDNDYRDDEIFDIDY